MAAEAALAAAFVAYSREKLVGQYLPRVRAAVARLDADQLWWRAHESDNSVGNLLLHLEGNVRQWILAGLGGEPDRRRRDAEFAARQATAADELLARLEATVGAADGVLAAMTADKLQARYTIQGYGVSGLEAVYHVVEHFSTHLGQIAYVAKMLTGRPLDFYRYLESEGAGGRKP